MVNDPSHHERPQDTAQIDRALTLAREGVDALGALGHLAHLALGPEPERPEWPKVVFSLDHPRGFLCFCEQDFRFLGDGWHETLDEVKHEAAVREQYRGRGGQLPKSGLPLVVAELSPLDKLRKQGLE